MKFGIVLAAGAALALSACNSTEDADTAMENAAAPTEAADAAQVAAAPAAEAGGKPTREFMIGKWGEDGDCALAIDFKADGSMDGPVDKWEFEDGVLTMVGLPNTFHLTVIDDKTLESRADGSGKPHKLTRC